MTCDKALSSSEPYYHTHAGQHSFGGVKPNFARMMNTNCFQAAPPGRKNNNELLQCLFFDGHKVVPDERLLCYSTRNVSQVDGYLFRSVTQLVKQMCCLLPE